MAISFVIRTCCELSSYIPEDKAEKFVPKIASALDVILGVALLMIGLLGANSMLTISPAASWALIGVGSIYTALVFLYLIAVCTDNINRERSEES